MNREGKWQYLIFARGKWYRPAEYPWAIIYYIRQTRLRTAAGVDEAIGSCLGEMCRSRFTTTVI